MPTRAKILERHAKEDEEMRRRFLVAAFQHHEGRKFFWDLLADAGVLGGNPFSLDAKVMAFNCGKMEIGNRLLAAITEAVGEQFADAMKEMNNVRAQRNADLAAADPDVEHDSRGGVVYTPDD